MKAKELRELTREELQQRLRETEQELFNLRVQQTMGRIEKPSRLRDLRRDVARMKTLLHQAALKPATAAGGAT
jgi:large subunit ribosomal protein L29